jgi:hypothetical protein
MSKSFQEVLEDAGYETRDYSGRGMCGQKCLAVVTSDSIGQIFSEVLYQLSSKDEDSNLHFDCAKAFKKMCSDNMGHDMVYYFPGISYENEV